ncbi:MAG: serine hydrolase [Bacteroidetes bacterium]|nr:serine hydrolase [Bacteroidota bacterium]MCY4205034.1 serine hydrolase [Bacteroidota bacterium]
MKIWTRFSFLILSIGILTLGACRSTREIPAPAPVNLTPINAPPSIQNSLPVVNSPTVIYPNALARIDSIIIEFINAQAFPGAVVSLGKGSEIIKMTGYGGYTYRSRRRMLPESIFDLASLTKVIATTTAAMILYERGELDIEAPVSRYLDAFNTPERQSITIRHLLTHTSGLPAFRPFHQDGITSGTVVMDSILSAQLLTEPGKEYLYSDFGMISFALVIETITGEPFDQWCARNIFAPLEMNATGFRGTGETDPSVVPTELDDYFRHRLIQGEVHDETAWTLGGVSGHAGLFSTAQDLTKFARMMSQGGLHNGDEFLQAQTINLFTTVVDTSLSTRALGWDTRNLNDEPSSAGLYFGPRSYGHTGFTGTSLWIDPDSKAWVILLTNRVYPTRDRYDRFRGVRGLIADAVYEAFFWPLPETKD